MAKDATGELNLGEGAELLDDSQPMTADGEDIEGGGTAQEGGATEDAEAQALQGLMQKRGFKTTKEMVEAFEKQERTNTELAKQARLSRLTQPVVVQSQVQPERKNFEVPEDLFETISDNKRGRKFIEDFGAHVVGLAKDAARQAQVEAQAESMKREAYELIAEDPDKFGRLRPKMVELAEQYPNANLRKLYGMAEEAIKSDRRAQGLEYLREAGLDPDTLEALKVVAGKAKGPHVSSGTGGTGVLTTKQAMEKKLRDEILGASKLEE